MYRDYGISLSPDVSYFNIDQAEIFEIILAANYLDIKTAYHAAY